MSGLFFADDMLLFASSEYNMKKLLEIMANYAQKWKIEFSGPKSIIIPLRQKVNTDRKWKMGNKYLSETDKQEINISETNEAKYLGITLCKHKHDMLAKHRSNITDQLKSQVSKCYGLAIATAMVQKSGQHM